jgi:hypothetical protein
MKMKIYLTSLIIILFLSCKSNKNCILDINFKRQSETPGPDLISFTITSKEKVFENYIEENGLIEVIFNNEKSFKSKVFGIIKIDENKYKLKIRSPYFSIIDYYTDEEIYTLFNNSPKTIINITLNDKKFIFSKC